MSIRASDYDEVVAKFEKKRKKYDDETDFTATYYKVMKEREELYRRAESRYADENTELDEHEAEEESDDSDKSL